MNWEYRIGKDFREMIKRSDMSLESIAAIAKRGNKEFTRIKDSLIKTKGEQWIYDNLQCHLDDLIDHFDFCKDLANGTIPETEWDDFEIAGREDIKDLLNGYLNEMYDLCDTTIGQDRKLCWIEA
jgi:hypothetical protein